MSNLNMPMERSYTTFYLLAVCNVCPLCHRFRDIDNRYVHDVDLGLYNGPKSEVNTAMERQYITLFVGNCHVCPIYHRLGDIISQNVRDLDLGLTMGQLRQT